MNVFKLEVAAVAAIAAIAQAAMHAMVDGSTGVARLEAQARADGFLDEQGYFCQSDEELLADLSFGGVVSSLIVDGVEMPLGLAA